MGFSKYLEDNIEMWVDRNNNKEPRTRIVAEREERSAGRYSSTIIIPQGSNSSFAYSYSGWQQTGASKRGMW